MSLGPISATVISDAGSRPQSQQPVHWNFIKQSQYPLEINTPKVMPKCRTKLISPPRSAPSPESYNTSKCKDSNNPTNTACHDGHHQYTLGHRTKIPVTPAMLHQLTTFAGSPPQQLHRGKQQTDSNYVCKFANLPVSNASLFSAWLFYDPCSHPSQLADKKPKRRKLN